MNCTIEKHKHAQERLARARVLLIIVAYRTPSADIAYLKKKFEGIEKSIVYGVYINGYRENIDQVEDLTESAIVSIRNSSNIGYGRAVNQLVNILEVIPRYIGVLNTDVMWSDSQLCSALNMLDEEQGISLLVPEIVSLKGDKNMLCKRDPTIFALLSRRFIPEAFKNEWIKEYDKWFTMQDTNYSQMMEVEYLSGCFMLIRSSPFRQIGGFDERFFLYLEDADLTRRLRMTGKCIHYPFMQVRHRWGRGNYKSVYLTLVSIHSIWLYFSKWGFKIF